MIKLSLKKGFTHTLTFKRKLVSGFTLLEALVAISILMVAVVAPITIAQKGLSSAVYSKNQMIASYLAQDAIEYIKNKRDLLTINSLTFDWANLSEFNFCKFPLSCQIDTIHEGVLPFGAGNPLSKDVDNFYQYEHDDNGTTNFTREIMINLKDITTDGVTRFDEALVTVTVRWGVDSVIVKTLIYNY